MLGKPPRALEHRIAIPTSRDTRNRGENFAETKHRSIDEPYAYPTPDGFAAASPGPAGARFDESLGEFVLPYDAVRRARNPAGELMDFLQSTYDAAAELGEWDRDALECSLGEPRRPRPPFDAS